MRKKQPSTSGAGTARNGMFRPAPLLPPALVTQTEDYKIYLASYRMYLAALKTLRQDFWDEVQKNNSMDERYYKYRTFTEEKVDRPTYMVVGGQTQKIHHSRVAATPVVSSVERWVPAPGGPEKDTSEETLARRRAARRRQRAARRARDIEAAAKLATNLAVLGAQNKSLHKQEGNNSWTVVTRKGKPQQRLGKQRPTSKAAPSAPAKAAPAPNRKERRQAKFGLPSRPTKVVERVEPVFTAPPASRPGTPPVPAASGKERRREAAVFPTAPVAPWAAAPTPVVSTTTDEERIADEVRRTISHPWSGTPSQVDAASRDYQRRHPQEFNDVDPWA